MRAHLSFSLSENLQFCCFFGGCNHHLTSLSLTALTSGTATPSSSSSSSLLLFTYPSILSLYLLTTTKSFSLVNWMCVLLHFGDLTFSGLHPFLYNLNPCCPLILFILCLTLTPIPGGQTIATQCLVVNLLKNLPPRSPPSMKNSLLSPPRSLITSRSVQVALSITPTNFIYRSDQVTWSVINLHRFGHRDRTERFLSQTEFVKLHPLLTFSPKLRDKAKSGMGKDERDVFCW